MKSVHGISVNRVLAIIRVGRVSVFSGITRLVLLHQTVRGDYAHEGNTGFMLDKHQVASLLQQVSLTLVELVISQCDMMEGIQFPALTNLRNTSGFGSIHEVSASVIQSCPLLQKLDVSCMDGDAMTALLSHQPQRMEMLRIKDFVSTLNDTVSQFMNLKHLSIIFESSPLITNSFFVNMHKLEVLKLDYNQEDEEEENVVAGQFNDIGVRILLRNNQSLKKVALIGFEFTDKSLEYFTDYVKTHGLEKLELYSTSATKFTLKAVYDVAAAGLANKVRKMLIHGTDRDFEWIEK